MIHLSTSAFSMIAICQSPSHTNPVLVCRRRHMEHPSSASASWPGPLCGILVCVQDQHQTFLPINANGMCLTRQFLDAVSFAAWLRAFQLPYLTATEFSTLGHALPPQVKGHIMVQIAIVHEVPLEVAPTYFLKGQLVLAAHRRFIRGTPRTIFTI